MKTDNSDQFNAPAFDQPNPLAKRSFNADRELDDLQTYVNNLIGAGTPQAVMIIREIQKTREALKVK